MDEQGKGGGKVMKMFNPYQHLTRSFRLDAESEQRIRAELTRDQLAALENGAVIRVGAAAKVWMVPA